ncbi:MULTISPECIES: hypothetical protein [unclassified Streptococcus]|uniref:hypothetical protein n=1 Tax=unclassified Streptococcus TaxID=2608887 RepID=UPI0020C90A5B|nr:MULTISPECIES: hypothetical protein [unclassified Streptococcus]MCP8963015.1 hypothetical protein [Streptococcus sp. CF8_St5-12]MCP8980956.1 hypothetical protein [Streptococcus sp. CF8_St5-16]MCP8982805.1 hypothetical protein [Streptococcus sp. CF8_St5-13]MCP9039565.1 hypothetical protein [Streptococcus sp. CF8_St5-11]
MQNNSWNGTSYEIVDDESNRDLIEFLQYNNVELEEEKGKYILYQNNKTIFNLNDYIETKTHFTDIEDYFSDIDFSEKIDYIYRDNHNWKSEEIDVKDEMEKYNNVVKSNIINRDIKNFSVNLLRKVENPSQKILHLNRIFILLFLSTNTEIKILEDGFIFDFRISEDRISISERYAFSEVNINDIDLLNSVYDWVINDTGYYNTYKQRLDIVRSIIVKNGTFRINEDIVNKAESIFKRIISQETDKYFEEVSNLKNDFLKITERENDIYQSLHLKLMGWMTALSLLIFDKIKDYDGADVISRLLNSSSEKTQLLLVLLVCALLVILIIYILEMWKNQDEYLKLKDFYTKSLMFNGDDFKNKVKFPIIDDRYVVLILVVGLILILRIFFLRDDFIKILVVLPFIYIVYIILRAKDIVGNSCIKLNKKEKS